MKTPLFTPILFFLFVTTLFSQETNFSFFQIPAELTKNANAVILFEDTFINVHSQNEMTIKVKTAVTVLNKLGDRHKYVRVHFDKNQKVKHVAVKIYNAAGDEIEKVKRKEFEDISAVDGGTLYGDSRMLYYRYVPNQYPYTIYSEYEIETINTGFVWGWRPIGGYLTSVMSSSYNLISENGLKLRFKEQNFEGFTIEKETSDTELSYKMVNQPAFKYEPYSPYLRNLTPYLVAGLYRFSLEGINGEATNWKEFGKWRYDYLKNGNDEIQESVKNEVRALVNGIEDPVEKAKIVYEYVQNRTRYISIQEGIGGWMPISANDVHRFGYGDCKGLSNYTKTLLDAVGVEAYYTVIWADKKRDMVSDFFSMQGNHIIVNIPNKGKDIWLECTSQKVPFGYLGSFTDDRDALVITPNGGIIKHTKIYKATENLQYTKGNYEIDAEGNIKAQLKITSKGTQYKDNLDRNDGVSKKELTNLFKNYFSYINNIHFLKMEVLNNREEVSFDEEMTFEASNYSTISGDVMLIPINAFNRISSTPSRVRNRKLPFELKSGFTDIDEVEIKLPPTLDLVYIPESKTITSKYGSYSIEVSKIDEHTYLYKRNLQIKAGNYPKEDYDLYRTFRKNIRKIDNSKIVVKSKL